MSRLNDYISRLPKTETHLHLEGATPLELLQAANPGKYGDRLPEWDEDHRFHTFEDFQIFFDTHVITHYNNRATNLERYHQSARRIFELQRKQNVRYVETSFHGPNAVYSGVPVGEIVQAILSAVPEGLIVRVFAGICRNEYFVPGVEKCVEDMLACDGLSGIDLHGYESLPMLEWTEKVWARFQAAGKRTKAHAGEFGGHHAVRESIERLKVRQIAHGVQSAEDPEVLKLVLDTGTVLDVCPYSNVKLRVARSLKEHQLHALLAAGASCTVSTDDPIAFGITLEEEYRRMVEEGGFTPDDLKKVNRTGFEKAEADAALKKAWLAELDAVTF
jgi:adenosine deaminase